MKFSRLSLESVWLPRVVDKVLKEYVVLDTSCHLVSIKGNSYSQMHPYSQTSILQSYHIKLLVGQPANVRTHPDRSITKNKVFSIEETMVSQCTSEYVGKLQGLLTGS